MQRIAVLIPRFLKWRGLSFSSLGEFLSQNAPQAKQLTKNLSLSLFLYSSLLSKLKNTSHKCLPLKPSASHNQNFTPKPEDLPRNLTPKNISFCKNPKTPSPGSLPSKKKKPPQPKTSPPFQLKWPAAP